MLYASFPIQYQTKSGETLINNRDREQGTGNREQGGEWEHSQDKIEEEGEGFMLTN
jgi:hypothetical protein